MPIEQLTRPDSSESENEDKNKTEKREIFNVRDKYFEDPETKKYYDAVEQAGFILKDLEKENQRKQKEFEKEENIKKLSEQITEFQKLSDQNSEIRSYFNKLSQRLHTNALSEANTLKSEPMKINEIEFDFTSKDENKKSEIAKNIKTTGEIGKILNDFSVAKENMLDLTEKKKDSIVIDQADMENIASFEKNARDLGLQTEYYETTSTLPEKMKERYLLHNSNAEKISKSKDTGFVAQTINLNEVVSNKIVGDFRKKLSPSEFQYFENPMDRNTGKKTLSQTEINNFFRVLNDNPYLDPGDPDMQVKIESMQEKYTKAIASIQKIIEDNKEKETPKKEVKKSFLSRLKFW